MDSWDCYCVLCLEPLDIYNGEVGDNTPEALVKSRKALSNTMGRTLSKPRVVMKRRMKCELTQGPTPTTP